MNAPIDLRTVTNMTSKGQVLIPKEIRDRLGLRPGSPVEVGINERGEAVVLPRTRRVDETPEQRVARFLAVLEQIRPHYRTDRTTDEIMRDLRGDEPLP